MTLDDLKSWTTVLGTLVAALALLKGIFEYSNQNAMRRLDLFLAMRQRFEATEGMKRIREALESDEGNAFASVTKKDKVDFLAFYEDLALMVDSEKMHPEIAQYYFGFYAILARPENEEAFWVDLDRKSNYWRVFRQFADKMERDENKLFSKSQIAFRL